MRLLIAGGGTGGHIFPGVAVARAWLRENPEDSVLFVGTAKGVEARVLPREGLPLETISTAGVFGRTWVQKIMAAFSMIRGFIKSLGVVGRFRPHVVLGLGGYASAPAVAAAWFRRCPVVLIEQNTIPGVANRMLSRIAARVAVGLPIEGSYFARHKVVETGLPLRAEFEEISSRPESFWGGPLRILIFGGSQGAHAINRAVIEALSHLGDATRKMRFVHQTGEADLERVRDAYRDAGAEAEVEPFLFDMAERYRWAHLAVARAGAMTVAELPAAGLPSILIPLPTATHGHQEGNARFLEERGAARVMLQDDLTGERLAALWCEMDDERSRLAGMSTRASVLAKVGASEAVAALCRGEAKAA